MCSGEQVNTFSTALIEKAEEIYAYRAVFSDANLGPTQWDNELNVLS